MSVHLHLSSVTQLSLESNYFGFSKALSPKRSISENKKAEYSKTKADIERVSWEKVSCRGPQRPDFHCVDVNKKKKYLTV